MARSDARAETAVLSCAIRVVVCCRVKRKHYRFQTDSLVFRNYNTFSCLMNSESCLFLTVTICQSWWLGSSINSMGPVSVKPTLTKFGTIGGRPAANTSVWIPQKNEFCGARAHCRTVHVDLEKKSSHCPDCFDTQLPWFCFWHPNSHGFHILIKTITKV